MPFLQLSLESSALDPEALEAACFNAGALSVTLTDAADTPIFEPALDTTPLWPQVRLSALFDGAADRATIVAALARSLGQAAPEHRFEEIADRAWEREWLKDFKPMRFGRRLWICPHELSVEAPGATIVRLDPGLAFGTGTHQTTALCLEWLDGAQLAGRTVIDYGCGSGILAIAAVKLGASRAYAIDHDPQALLATRQNAERNGVERQIETLAAQATEESARDGLGCDSASVAHAGALAPADVLIANILALPLIALAPRFQALIAPQGHLVLSGILIEQADEVAAAYAGWLEMEPAVRRDDWVRLHGRRG